jgi:hypothetical protein
LITPEAVTLTWPAFPGKQYTILYSLDLTAESWATFDQAFVATGSEVEYGIPLVQSDGSRLDQCFWRVTPQDVDTDGDGLSDAEEYDLGTQPDQPDSDGDGWNDLVEFTHGTSSTNPDTDGDGIPDSLDVEPLDPDQADFQAATLLVISPQQ